MMLVQIIGTIVLVVALVRVLVGLRRDRSDTGTLLLVLALCALLYITLLPGHFTRALTLLAFIRPLDAFLTVTSVTSLLLCLLMYLRINELYRTITKGDLVRILAGGRERASVNAAVVIPVYNAEATLGDTLDALEAQEHPPVEVIVVDDGSTDRSPTIARGYADSSRHRVTVLEQDHQGPAAARNRGVETTDADIIMFLDADCIPPPDWLMTLSGALIDDVVGVSCGYYPANAEHLVARFVDNEIARRQERYLGKNVDALATYATAYRRDAFLAAGGFSTDFRIASGEDFDFAFNLQKHGGRLIFTNDTRVGHHHPANLGIYLRQQFYRGYWRVVIYLHNIDKFVHGDSYTGYEAQTQFVLANLAILSLPAATVHAAAPAIGLGLLLASNLPLGLWASRREPSMLLFAPLLASLRSLAGTAGVYAYFVDRLLGRIG